MKKTLSFFLCLCLALSAVSCSLRTGSSETGAAPDEADAGSRTEEAAAVDPPEQQEAEAETEAPAVPVEETLADLPEIVEAEGIVTLETAKPPEYKDGRLVIFFTDESVFYEADSPCSIGLISADAADSIPAALDLDSNPDIRNNNAFRGAVLVPEEPLPSGSYTFSVAIAHYIVSFDMTID